MSVMNLLPGGSTVQIPLDAPTSFSATAGNAQVELTWTDPLDKYATPEGEVSETGDQLVSEWDHTVLVRKTGSQPAGPNDGTVVTSSSVRNQYQTNGYTDTGLINDTVYYYAVFAYNKDGVASEGAFVSATPQAGTPLGDLTEGTLISINESGAPVEFYVAKQNYEEGLNGAGRVLMVRKDVYDQRQWNVIKPGSSYDNDWASSTMLSWLNSSYKGLFSPKVQEWIGNTTYQCTLDPESTIVTTHSDAIFIASLTELGESYYAANVEGTALPISATLKTAYMNGNAVDQWTRSPHISSYTNVIFIYSYGTVSSQGCDHSGGARPVFTLPSTAYVDSNLALIETA